MGYDLVEYAPKFWNPERKKHVIHIDFTPAEVDGYYQPAVEVVADVREALELLNGLVKGEKDPAPVPRAAGLHPRAARGGRETTTRSRSSRSASCATCGR